jgi:hypothetical protein
LNSTGGGSRAEGTFSTANQFAFRSSSQSYRDFGGFDFYGTPGILEEGTMVRNRQELIRLPDVSKMLAEVRIPESRVRQIQVGMTAYIHVQNIPNRRFKGAVRRVGLLPDAQSSWMNPNVKLYPADILVDDELPILKPGVSATAEIIITNLTNVLSVPIQTVARLRGENVCFIKKGLRVVPVPVKTGLFNDAFVEVTSGLKEGDLVLLAAVGDEDVEPPGETNDVEGATQQTQQPQAPTQEAPVEERRPRRGFDPTAPGFSPDRQNPQFGPPTNGPPGEERRMRLREFDSTESSASPERRRGRPGGRRPQNSEESPE